MPHDSQGNAGDSLGQDNGNLATTGSLACELVTAAQTCTVCRYQAFTFAFISRHMRHLFRYYTIGIKIIQRLFFDTAA